MMGTWDAEETRHDLPPAVGDHQRDAAGAALGVAVAVLLAVLLGLAVVVMVQSAQGINRATSADASAAWHASGSSVP